MAKGVDLGSFASLAVRNNDSKFWKFAMLRCDMYLFRKDRKAWVQKMKQSVKGPKQ
ncbi:hypothetical protein ANCDUO_22425 [Ancylostoma duodenale]|uniref:Uncharacterized protein n=1 Tax=Ancylostoma duodenale TaxID=51022 RepID=A0A0C2FL73_9BILA|nr:hypothetical protein ANCDUO_22425 [Ancylostoma duodenale]